MESCVNDEMDPEITFKERPNNGADVSQNVGEDPEQRRISSSSEEHIDTSDALMDVDNECIHDKFIVDCQAKAKRKKSLQEEEVRARDHAGQVIRQAEAAKAHIFVTPGNVEVPLLHNNFDRQIQQVVSNQVGASYDENYIMVGANINAGLQDKIKRGEYVDFSRLLPRDRQNHDDHRLEIVYKGDQTYFVPAGDRDSNARVTNFHRWEQAFRVYLNIYLHKHPE